MRRILSFLPVCVLFSCALSGPLHAAPIVRIRLETTDAIGNPISQVSVGENFQLRAHVQDVRPVPQGVFSAFADVTYNAELASVSGPVVFVPPYINGQSGNTATPGLLDEVGAFDGFGLPDAGERLLFHVPFQADAPGIINFVADPADLRVHETLVFGLVEPIPPEQVDYGLTSLQIVPEPASVVLMIGSSLVLLVCHRRRRRTSASCTSLARAPG